MSEQLEAAEAVLATIQAGRTRLAVMAHRALPFDRSLALELAYRVGNTPERIALETPRAVRELPSLRTSVASGPGDLFASPPPFAAPAAATAGPRTSRTGTPETAGPGIAKAEEEVPPTAEVDARAAATHGGISLDELIHDPLPGGAPTSDAGAPVRFADLADLPLVKDDEDEDRYGDDTSPGPAAEASDASPAAPAPRGLRAAAVASRRRAASGSTAEEPAAAAATDAPSRNTPPPHDAGPAAFDEEATTAIDAPPALRAAAVRDRSLTSPTGGFTLSAPRSVGPRIGGPDPGAGQPAGSQSAGGSGAAVATPAAALGAPRIALGTPKVRSLGTPVGGLEVIDRGSEGPRAEPTGAAAIQILGVGQARTLTPTLELGSADPEDEDALPAEGPAPGAGGFSVGFLEPEEEPDAIPELSAGDDEADDAPAASILTPDGMIPSESGRVQEAADDDDDVRRFRSAAAEAERNGDLQAAVVSWTDVLDLRPSDLGAHLGRGRALVELRDYAAAVSDFQRAEDLAPDSGLPLFEMGNLFFARMEYQKAIPYFDQAIELEPAHAMAWCRRGISHLNRKNAAQAVADLEEAAALDPSIPGLRRYVQMAAKAAKKTRR